MNLRGNSGAVLNCSSTNNVDYNFDNESNSLNDEKWEQKIINAIKYKSLISLNSAIHNIRTWTIRSLVLV
jgi:hypothetical protein